MAALIYIRLIQQMQSLKRIEDAYHIFFNVQCFYAKEQDTTLSRKDEFSDQDNVS